MHRFFFALPCLALPVSAAAQDQVALDLTGLKLQNGLNQSKSSAPAALAPATRYSYSIAGMVKGNSGLLKTLYPDPIALADLLESFEPGASALLSGSACNPPGTHPVTFVNETFEGEADLGLVTAELAVTVQAGIDASNFAGFSMTDVVLKPSIILGSMIFTSGEVVITRIPCPADFDGSGTLDVDDFIAFQTGFALGLDAADFSCDQSLGIDDFIEFQTAFAVGCP